MVIRLWPISLDLTSWWLFLLLVELGRLLAPSPLPMWLGRRGYTSACCLIHRWLRSWTHSRMGLWTSVEGAGWFAQLHDEQPRPEFPVTPNSSRLTVYYCTPAADLRGSVSNYKFVSKTCTCNPPFNRPLRRLNWTSCMSWKASQKPSVSSWFRFKLLWESHHTERWPFPHSNSHQNLKMD